MLITKLRKLTGQTQSLNRKQQAESLVIV